MDVIDSVEQVRGHYHAPNLTERALMEGWVGVLMAVFEAAS